MLCDGLEGWDGGGLEGGPRVRGHVHTADSLCCAAETSITLYSNYAPNFKKKLV